MQMPWALPFAVGCLLALIVLSQGRTLSQTSAAASPPPFLAQIPAANTSTEDWPWPTKQPGTLRFGVVLNNPATDVTSREQSDGYRFWEASVNADGGIKLGGGKRLRVEVLFAIDGGDAERHADLLHAAATEGGADFLLGAATGMAWQDKNASVTHNILTMLCCHGPPNVYAEAAAAAEAAGKPNHLFGIHISSELYTRQLVRHIAVNGKAKRIAVTVLLDEAAPLQGSLFTNTTCEAAVRQLQAISESGIYESTPDHDVFVVPISQAQNLTFFGELASSIKNGSYDVVLACSLAADGANLMRALEEEEVPLKALFVTVAPTAQPTVANLTAAGVRVQHVLSAGQWHPELDVYATELEGALWSDPANFAREFAKFSGGTAATYTIASAAAAANAVQLSLEAAFQNCNLTDSNGDVDELLYSSEGPCQQGAGVGYELVLAALRDLKRDTFFGPISFDEKQRNHGRDTMTTQLLGAAGRSSSIFASIDFGVDRGVNETHLVQEVVLPSQFETHEIMIPRPKRPYDPDTCPDGYGLDDATGACRVCARGSVRQSLYNNGTSYECLLCGLASFADEEGLSECKLCPNGTTTLRAGAIAVTNCTCKTGFFNEYMLDGVECLECPEGAVCPGGKKHIMAKPGYWLDTANAMTAESVQRCNPPGVCINAGNQTCAEGWGGDLCSLCGYNNGEEQDENYYLFFGSCEKCISSVGNSIIILAIFVAWVLLNLVVAERYESLALVIDWMQLMSLVGSANANWPDSLRRFFTIARLFAFEVDVVSWRCLSTQWTFTADLILQFSLPLVITALWGAVAFLAAWRRRVRRHRREASKRRAASMEPSDTTTKPPGAAPDSNTDSEGDGECCTSRKAEDGEPPATPMSPRLVRSASRVQHTWQIAFHVGKTAVKRASASFDRLVSDRYEGLSWASFIARMLSIFEITYLASTQYAMSALRTVSIGGETRLAAAPYLGQSPAIVALGAVGLTVYGVIFPLFLFLVLAMMSPSWPGRAPHRIKDDPKSDRGGFMHTTNLQMMGWLYAKFRVERWYMSTAHLLHRFLMIAAITLVVKTDLQLLLGAIVTVTFACLFIAAQPYYIKRLNVMQCILYVSVLFQLFFAACFYSPYVGWWNPGWVDAFTIISLLFIGVAAFTYAWIFMMELMEWLCVHSCKRALRRRFPRLQQQHLGALVDVFSAYRLHSWIFGEVKASLQPDAADGGAFEAHARAKELATPGLILFATVADHLQKYLGPDNEYVYLSTRGDAMLWRQVVLTYPELLTYLFNERDGDAAHWGAFFEKFYKHYWRLQDRAPGKKPRWAIVEKLGTVIAANLPDGQLSDRFMNRMDSGMTLETAPLMTGRFETPLTPAARHGTPLPSAAWLIRRRDRAVIAHWLATHVDVDPARQELMELMRLIGTCKHKSWEERVMRVLTFNSLSCFHEPVPLTDRQLSKVFSSEMRSRSKSSAADAARAAVDEVTSPMPPRNLFKDCDAAGKERKCVDDAVSESDSVDN